MTDWAGRLISPEVAARVGPCRGIGSGTARDPGLWHDELRNLWTPTTQAGLCFHSGNLQQSRHFSRYLGLQRRPATRACRSRSTVRPSRHCSKTAAPPNELVRRCKASQSGRRRRCAGRLRIDESMPRREGIIRGRCGPTARPVNIGVARARGDAGRGGERRRCTSCCTTGRRCSALTRGMAFRGFCDPKSRAQALAASVDPWNAVVHDPGCSRDCSRACGRMHTPA
ncbi:predicted flavoprotein (plasmid) [Methylobacterium aquaticum]|uniref:Predicted flavoprotein n=1 Tax=Methylobacterium aquaticum TaxID=270351 RepID=A0A1Y0Z967_9HYPH|nr:predicted flavoprotein [Methylobacterium aquaticum]